MSSISLHRIAGIGSLAAALALGACTGDAGLPTDAPSFLISDNPAVVACDNEDLALGQFKLIKVGGTGVFEVEVRSLAGTGPVIESFTVTLDDGDCAIIHQNYATVSTQSTGVTVTEVQGAFLWAEIARERDRFKELIWVHTTEPTVWAPISGPKAAIARFYNDADEPEEPGDEGCTPGYWKNHVAAWGPTGLTTGQTVASVFSAAAGTNVGNASLLDALDFGGGPGANGARLILARAAVAAALNAAHPNVAYGQSLADVQAQVNGVIGGNNRNAMLGLATTLDTQNNAGCPLN